MSDAKRHSWHTQLLRAVSSVSLACLAGTTCASSSQTATSSGGGPAQVPAASVQAPPPPMGRPEDGKAGKPEDKPGEMLEYVSQLAFGEGVPPSDIIDQELPCEPTPAQCGGAQAVRIRIVPANNAPNVAWNAILNPGGGPLRNGHVVAKITNMTNNPFGPLGLDANDVAYLWVGSIGNSDQQGAAVYKFTASAARMLRRSTRNLICNKPASPPAVHLFPMMGCDQNRSSSSASNSSMLHLASFFKPAKSDAMVHTSGLWVSCTEGCCQVQMAVQ